MRLREFLLYPSSLACALALLGVGPVQRPKKTRRNLIFTHDSRSRQRGGSYLFCFCVASRSSAGPAAAFSGCAHNHDDGKHIQACGEGGLQRESAHLAGRSVLHSQSPQRRGLARWRNGRMGRRRRRRSSASERARRGRRPGHDERERPTSSQSHREEARGLVRTTRTPTAVHTCFFPLLPAPYKTCCLSRAASQEVTARLRRRCFLSRFSTTAQAKDVPLPRCLVDPGRCCWSSCIGSKHSRNLTPSVCGHKTPPPQTASQVHAPHWTTVDMTHSLVQPHRSPRAAPGWRWGRIYRRGCHPVTRVPVHTSLIGLFGNPQLTVTAAVRKHCCT